MDIFRGLTECRRIRIEHFQKPYRVVYTIQSAKEFHRITNYNVAFTEVRVLQSTKR